MNSWLISWECAFSLFILSMIYGNNNNNDDNDDDDGDDDANTKS